MEYYFVFLDIGLSPSVIGTYFDRSMLQALLTAAKSNSRLAKEITELITNIKNTEDSLGVFFALQQIHDLL